MAKTQYILISFIIVFSLKIYGKDAKNNLNIKTIALSELTEPVVSKLGCVVSTPRETVVVSYMEGDLTQALIVGDKVKKGQTVATQANFEAEAELLILKEHKKKAELSLAYERKELFRLERLNNSNRSVSEADIDEQKHKTNIIEIEKNRLELEIKQLAYAVGRLTQKSSHEAIVVFSTNKLGLIPKGETILKLIDPNMKELKCRFSLEEKDQLASLTFKGRDGKVFDLNRIDQVADHDIQSFVIYLKPINGLIREYLGERVDINIESNSKHQLTVPISSVKTNEFGSFIYLVTDKKQVEEISVKLSSILDDRYILSIINGNIELANKRLAISALNELKHGSVVDGI